MTTEPHRRLSLARRLLPRGGAALLISAAAIGIGSSAASAAKIKAIMKPPTTGLITPRELVVCSDLTYPPEEFTLPDGTTPTGTDITIADDVAALMGLQVSWVNIPSATILTALSANKCDIIFNGMGETPAREKIYNFVPYVKEGGGLLVKHGNPDHINGVDSLAGQSVAYEQGTLFGSDIEAASKQLVKDGKQAIDLVAYPSDTAAYQALSVGRVAAFAADSMSLAYHATLSKGQYQIGGPPFDLVTIGAVVRKNENALRADVKKAIAHMYSTGMIQAIYKKWGITSAIQYVH